MQIFLCSHKNSRKMKHRLEWPTNQDKLLDGHYISVSWTGMKLGPTMYFVNKQLTYFIKNSNPLDFSPDSELAKSNEHFLKVWA